MFELTVSEAAVALFWAAGVFAANHPWVALKVVRAIDCGAPDSRLRSAGGHDGRVAGRCDPDIRPDKRHKAPSRSVAVAYCFRSQ